MCRLVLAAILAAIFTSAYAVPDAVLMQHIYQCRIAEQDITFPPIDKPKPELAKRALWFQFWTKTKRLAAHPFESTLRQLRSIGLESIVVEYTNWDDDCEKLIDEWWKPIPGKSS